MVLQKVWEGAKFTAETVRGAALVLAKPNDPVPPAKLHPRMMPMPFTVGEWVSFFNVVFKVNIVVVSLLNKFKTTNFK